MPAADSQSSTAGLFRDADVHFLPLSSHNVSEFWRVAHMDGKADQIVANTP